MSKDNKTIDPARAAFKVSSILIVFLLGGILAKTEFYLFELLEKGYDATRTLIEEKKRKRPILLKRSAHKGEGVTLNEASQAHQGLTLMQGWFPGGPQARLIDMNGQVVHRWKINFFEIWKDPKHIYPQKNIPKTPFNYDTQGIVALPDGSIVANIGRSGTVKLGKCNEVIWTVDRMTHHSVTLAKDGGYWIPANKDIREISKKLHFNHVNLRGLNEELGRYENLILYVNAEGKVKKEFSVLQAIVDAGLEHQLYDAAHIRKYDPTHINDVEVVTSSLANKIGDGEVKAGDLLVSVRQFHMLAIIDQDSGKLKWFQKGPWVRQHDPDILENGNIVVFNNRPALVKMDGTPGSNIIEFDPSDRTSKILYPGSNNKAFYSDILGTHQRLPNGNWLINESRAGRVFEVNPAGDIVWQFIQPYDDKYAALIEVAERYDRDYFSVSDWQCDKS